MATSAFYNQTSPGHLSSLTGAGLTGNPLNYFWNAPTTIMNMGANGAGLTVAQIQAQKAPGQTPNALICHLYNSFDMSVAGANAGNANGIWADSQANAWTTGSPTQIQAGLAIIQYDNEGCVSNGTPWIEVIAADQVMTGNSPGVYSGCSITTPGTFTVGCTAYRHPISGQTIIVPGDCSFITNPMAQSVSATTLSSSTPMQLLDQNGAPISGAHFLNAGRHGAKELVHAANLRFMLTTSTDCGMPSSAWQQKYQYWLTRGTPGNPNANPPTGWQKPTHVFNASLAGGIAAGVGPGRGTWAALLDPGDIYSIQTQQIQGTGAAGRTNPCGAPTGNTNCGPGTNVYTGAQCVIIPQSYTPNDGGQGKAAFDWWVAQMLAQATNAVVAVANGMWSPGVGLNQVQIQAGLGINPANPTSAADDQDITEAYNLAVANGATGFWHNVEAGKHANVPTCVYVTFFNNLYNKLTSANPPTVTGLSVTNGPVTGGGPAITISGTNFEAAGLGVTFTPTGGGTAITGTNPTFVNSSPPTVTVVPPAAPAPGKYDVQVTDGNGTSVANAKDVYTYNFPVPSVSSISPTSGNANTQVTLTVKGTGFFSVSAVTFTPTSGGTPVDASFTPGTSTQLTCTTPALAAGTYDVQVVTPGGTSGTSTKDQYTYNAVQTTPIIQSAQQVAGTNHVALTWTLQSGASGSVTINDTFPYPGGTTTVVATLSAGTTMDTLTSVATGSHGYTVTDNGQTSPVAAVNVTGSVATITGMDHHAGPTSGGQAIKVTGSGFTGA